MDCAQNIPSYRFLSPCILRMVVRLESSQRDIAERGRTTISHGYMKNGDTFMIIRMVEKYSHGASMILIGVVKIGFITPALLEPPLIR